MFSYVVHKIHSHINILPEIFLVNNKSFFVTFLKTCVSTVGFMEYSQDEDIMLPSIYSFFFSSSTSSLQLYLQHTTTINVKLRLVLPSTSAWFIYIFFFSSLGCVILVYVSCVFYCRVPTIINIEYNAPCLDMVLICLKKYHFS